MFYSLILFSYLNNYNVSKFYQARHRIEIPEPVDIGDHDQDSIATSIEVQTGNSVVEAKEVSESFTHRVQQHHKGTRAQTLRLKVQKHK